MSKKSSYQKLNSELAQLHSDMRKIICGGDFVEVEILKQSYKMAYQIEDIIWAGSTTKEPLPPRDTTDGSYQTFGDNKY